MDHFADERDQKLLEGDKYTFFVLRLIIGGDCRLLLTDHERLILCFSCTPFPVWIWTPDDVTPEEMEKAYQLVKEHFSLDEGLHFNCKYPLAEYFIQRAAKEGKNLSISINMFAYDCTAPIAPTAAADGSIYRCREEDLEELVDIMELFYQEIGIDQKDRDGYRTDAAEFIRSGRMFFWKDAQGNTTASCKYKTDGDMASVNLVFTHPAFRRKHYAENLVYRVTRQIIDEGYVPMLYTNADYTASNACYEKIGYELRGKLCTVVL